MLADTCMKSSIKYNASVDTRQPTAVIVDITRDITLPEDASHPSTLPVFEPYPIPTTIEKMPSGITTQLLHASLDYVESLAGAEVPIGDSSTMALADVTVIRTTREAGSGFSGGLTDSSNHTAATNGSASWPLDTANKDISFATVHTNQEAAEVWPVPTSRAIFRISTAGSEHMSTGASTRYDEPTEAKNGGGFSNFTIQRSPSHTRPSSEANSGKIFMTTEPEGQVSASTLPHTYTETGNWTPGPSSTAITPAPEPHGAIMDGTEFSRRLSQRGVALVLGSVAGGTIIFIGMVRLHRLILRLFHRSVQGSTMRRGPVSTDDPFVRQTPTVSSNVAGISHFSADS
ncbi:hypothetical protein N7466_001506 [Penicillium verhagenii]|uniref:uncharacterized protein n=1 Tax=Penicillium verhagenii TaxID=1562060 RepID=UPI002544EECB|nr:uncharacterized protein N7466_001506 [Penicillium verhagenii]KAJ5938372.1 hypothetical protein N7466_001506 [Penicillium verhagenii]